MLIYLIKHHLHVWCRGGEEVRYHQEHIIRTLGTAHRDRVHCTASTVSDIQLYNVHRSPPSPYSSASHWLTPLL